MQQSPALLSIGARQGRAANNECMRLLGKAGEKRGQAAEPAELDYPD
jgi:hypothetical protein